MAYSNIEEMYQDIERSDEVFRRGRVLWNELQQIRNLPDFDVIDEQDFIDSLRSEYDHDCLMLDIHFMADTIKQKVKLFRVDSDTGVAFRAVAGLLNIGSDELLENLMAEYVSSVRKGIGNLAHHHPSFCEKYPFVES